MATLGNIWFEQSCSFAKWLKKRNISQFQCKIFFFLPSFLSFSFLFLFFSILYIKTTKWNPYPEFNSLKHSLVKANEHFNKHRSKRLYHFLVYFSHPCPFVAFLHPRFLLFPYPLFSFLLNKSQLISFPLIQTPFFCQNVSYETPNAISKIPSCPCIIYAGN